MTETNHKSGEYVSVGNGGSFGAVTGKDGICWWEISGSQCWSPLQNERIHWAFEQRLNKAQTQDLVVYSKTVFTRWKRQRQKIIFIYYTNLYPRKPLGSSKITKKYKLFCTAPYTGRSSSIKPSFSRTEPRPKSIGTKTKMLKHLRHLHQLPNSFKNRGASLLGL